MDILIEFVPKVLCTLIDSYITKCHDCNINLIDDYVCTKCNRIRCQYCSFINSNEQACVECQDKYLGMRDPSTELRCVWCNNYAFYGITDHSIMYCWYHIPPNVNVYTYETFCKTNNCVGTGIFIDKQGTLYCSKHAKLYTGVLSRYTIIKN